MSSLTTLTRVKRELGILTYTQSGTLNPDNLADDDILADKITEASQMFETETRYSFSATPGATLVYDLQQPDVVGRKLFFGTPFLGVDRVINGDGTVFTAADYFLLPNNDTPKYGLVLNIMQNIFWQLSTANGYKQAIQVQGTTGFCATGEQPSDVTTAVTKLAAFLYQIRDNSGDITKFADGTMVIPAGVPDIVIRTINNYKRARIYT